MSIDVIVYDKRTQIAGIALFSNKTLKEIELISDNQALSGNIYLGRITKKISLANDKEGFFVNIGMDKEGFINAEEMGVATGKLTEGQSIVVQVSQEKRAEKNARLVRAVQLVGEYLVYCPYRMSVEGSSKVGDKTLLAEYIDVVKEHTTGQEGWVLRTASVEVPVESVLGEMKELRDLYEAIRQKARTAQAPALLYAKQDAIYEYISRYTNSLHKVVTNNHNVEKELKEKYDDAFDIEIDSDPFETYGVDETISEALEKTVTLRGGGRIIIEETRACIAIDVDSGRDAGGGNVSRINEEAAREIAHQIRLRNLAGKIVVDFAGQSEYRFLKSVIETLENELADDVMKAKVMGLSRLGLVEIVRTRRRPSLQDLLTQECRTCQGTGKVAADE